MAWGKLDDKFWSHPKVRRASLLASGMFARAISYSCDVRSDGFVPDYMLTAIADAAPYAATLDVAAELVAAGLWEVADGGWTIHDFGDYNPHSDHLKEVSQKRAEVGRLGGRRSGEVRRAASEANTKQIASEVLEANVKQTPKQTPKQTRSTTDELLRFASPPVGADGPPVDRVTRDDDHTAPGRVPEFPTEEHNLPDEASSEANSFTFASSKREAKTNPVPVPVPVPVPDQTRPDHEETTGGARARVPSTEIPAFVSADYRVDADTHVDTRAGLRARDARARPTPAPEVVTEDWPGQRAAFAALQSSYPKPVDDDLWGVFRLAVPTVDVWPDVQAGLAAWMASGTWAEDPGRFATEPRRWLQNRRWRFAPAAPPKKLTAGERTLQNIMATKTPLAPALAPAPDHFDQLARISARLDQTARRPS